jgi:methylglutamate dehydrogenase subunit D
MRSVCVSESPAWHRIGAWEGVANPGALGDAKAPDIRLIITPQNDLSIACLIGSAPDVSELIQYFSDRYRVSLPSVPKAVTVNDVTLLWAGPLQWLVISRQADLPSRLSADLCRFAAVSDQTDARSVLKMKGTSTRAALAKGCPIDLHPRAFRPDDTAITAIAGMGVQLWQYDEAFYLSVSRSMTRSFWSWLVAASAEFGVEVKSAEPS